MKLSYNDKLWGARSAIQKAVRRGDLDLCRTAFEILWEIPVHQQWLKWRLYSIVSEEAYYMGAELAKLLSSEADKKKWLRFFYILCLLPKSKDNVALYVIADAGVLEILTAGEVQIFRELVVKPVNTYNPKDLADLVYDFVIHNYELSDYELSAVEIFRKRAYGGGMLFDRILSSVSMFMVASRGLDEAFISKLSKDAVISWAEKFGRKPKTVEYPWWVFDKHTQIGQIVLKLFVLNHAEKFNLSENLFRKMWFNFESCRIPLEMFLLPSSDNVPSFLINQYHSEMLDILFQDSEKYRKLWDTSVSAVVKNFVEWSANKRIS